MPSLTICEVGSTNWFQVTTLIPVGPHFSFHMVLSTLWTADARVLPPWLNSGAKMLPLPSWQSSTFVSVLVAQGNWDKVQLPQHGDLQRWQMTDTVWFHGCDANQQFFHVVLIDTVHVKIFHAKPLQMITGLDHILLSMLLSHKIN